MLAQSFKTAEELKITDREHSALITVLGMLERGELRHAKYNVTGDNLFNMSCQGGWEPLMKERLCGTPACIGGWVAKIIKESQVWYVNFSYSRSLHALYWERTSDSTTIEQAAQATRNFLTTGKPNWSEVF